MTRVKSFLHFMFFFYVLFVITFCILYIPQALALESTPSATPSAELKIKLKELQDEISSKAAKLKQEITKKLQNRAYVGYIKTKSDSSITIATKKGNKIININEFTNYSSQIKSKSLTIKDFNIDDYIAALGDIDEMSILTAKKIIKTTSGSSANRQVMLGQIISFTENTIKIQTKNNGDQTFSTDANTIYQTRDSSKKGGLLINIPVGKPVVIVASKSKGDTMSARFVYTKTSTPSAITASPSAKQN